MTMHRPWLALGAAFFLATGIVAGASPASAQSFGDFTVTTDGGDGTVTARLPTAGYDLAFEIRGNDDGAGNRYTRFQTTAPATATVEYAWSYRTDDGPGYDSAGYTLGSGDVLLTSGGVANLSGSGSLDVTAGQVFGWYVNTMDGCCCSGFTHRFSSGRSQSLWCCIQTIWCYPGSRFGQSL